VEDVSKLRQRFIDPESQGYLFKKQNQEHNLPVGDMTPLLSKIWVLLTTNKELNLPNEKVQLANYRCEQIATEVNIISLRFVKNMTLISTTMPIKSETTELYWRKYATSSGRPPVAMEKQSLKSWNSNCWKGFVLKSER